MMQTKINSGNSTSKEKSIRDNSKQRFWERARDPKSMVLSHHPACKKYESHSFYIGHYRFCIGCFVGYPSAITCILIGTFLFMAQGTSLYLLLVVGIASYSSFLLSFIKYSEFKPVKMVQKFAIGFGSGFILVFAFFIFDIWIVLKFIIGFGVFIVLLQPIRTFHKAKLIAVCNACNVKATDPNCNNKEE